MEFTKEQSLTIIINNLKISAIHDKYKYTTKTKWWCLHCLKVIYVSYKQYGRNSILCPKCYTKSANYPTVVQYQYAFKLKQTQLKIVETQLYFDEKNVNIEQNNI
jgi:hypothetical protein